MTALSPLRCGADAPPRGAPPVAVRPPPHARGRAPPPEGKVRGWAPRSSCARLCLCRACARATHTEQVGGVGWCLLNVGNSEYRGWRRGETRNRGKEYGKRVCRAASATAARDAEGRASGGGVGKASTSCRRASSHPRPSPLSHSKLTSAPRDLAAQSTLPWSSRRHARARQYTPHRTESASEPRPSNPASSRRGGPLKWRPLSSSRPA
jgi:hypothetical protein